MSSSPRSKYRVPFPDEASSLVGRVPLVPVGQAITAMRDVKMASEKREREVREETERFKRLAAEEVKRAKDSARESRTRAKMELEKEKARLEVEAKRSREDVERGRQTDLERCHRDAAATAVRMVHDKEKERRALERKLIEDNEAKIRKVREEAELGVKEYEQRTREWEDRHARCVAAAETCRGHEVRVAELESELKGARGVTIEREKMSANEHAALRDELARVKDESNRSRKELEDAQKAMKVMELEASRRCKAGTDKALEKQTMAYESRLSSAERELDSLQRQWMSDARALDEAQSRLTRCVSEGGMRALEERSAVAIQQRAELSERLRHAALRRKELDDEIVALKQVNQKLREAKLASEKELIMARKGTSDAAMLQVHLTRARMQLENKDKQIAELASRLERQVGMTETVARSPSETVVRLQRELAAVRRQCEASRVSASAVRVAASPSESRDTPAPRPPTNEREAVRLAEAVRAELASMRLRPETEERFRRVLREYQQLAREANDRAVQCQRETYRSMALTAEQHASNGSSADMFEQIREIQRAGVHREQEAMRDALRTRAIRQRLSTEYRMVRDMKLANLETVARATSQYVGSTPFASEEERTRRTSIGQVRLYDMQMEVAKREHQDALESLDYQRQHVQNLQTLVPQMNDVVQRIEAGAAASSEGRATSELVLRSVKEQLEKSTEALKTGRTGLATLEVTADKLTNQVNELSRRAKEAREQLEQAVKDKERQNEEHKKSKEEAEKLMQKQKEETEALQRELQARKDRRSVDVERTIQGGDTDVVDEAPDAPAVYPVVIITAMDPVDTNKVSDIVESLQLPSWLKSLRWVREDGSVLNATFTAKTDEGCAVFTSKTDLLDRDDKVKELISRLVSGRESVLIISGYTLNNGNGDDRQVVEDSQSIEDKVKEIERVYMQPLFEA